MTEAPLVPFETLYATPSRNGVYKPAQHHGSGVKIVNMGELFAFDFVGSQEMNRLRMSDLEMSVSGLSDGDLLFGRRSLVESGAGKCSIVHRLNEPTTFESSVIRVRVDQEQIRPLFLFYWFKSPKGRGSIRAIVSGTNVKGIRGTDLKNVLVPVPLMPIQNQIAGILRTYDDLIENNRRRIKLLEEAARLIYREWFVRLRFPGHEHTKIENGVPEGWNRVKTSDLCDSLGGGTPATGNPAFWDGGDIPWVVPSDVTKNGYLFLPSTERQITDAGLRGSSAQMLPAETILMTSRASVGFFAVVDKTVCTNQGFINIVPRRAELRMYLLFCLMSRVEEIRALAGGSTYPEISKGKFREIGIIEPCKPVLEEFEQLVSPMINQSRILILQNQKLVQARDLLLPRLMSGEIEV